MTDQTTAQEALLTMLKEDGSNKQCSNCSKRIDRGNNHNGDIFCGDCWERGEWHYPSATSIVKQQLQMYPPKIIGIYYLLNDDCIVYVGQSIDVMKRIASHIVAGKKDFNGYHAFRCREQDLLHYEVHEILRHRPAYNKSLPSNSTYANVHTLRAIFRMTVGELLLIIRKSRILSEWICNQDVYKIEEVRKAIS